MNIVQSPYATGAYGGFGGVYGRNPMSTGVPGLPAESFYADPNVGPIAQNIGTALFGNPQMMRQNALSDAQIAQENARTQGLNFANAQQQKAATARAGIGALWQHLSTVQNPDGTTRAASPQEMIANAGAVFQGAVDAYPENPQAAGDAFRTYAGIQGNPQILSNAVAGAGGAFTSTPVGQKVAETAATGRTGIMAGAGIQETKIHEGGAMERQTQGQQFGLDHPAPMTVSPGATVLIPPNAKGYAGMGTPIPGASVPNPVGTESGTAPTTTGPSVGSVFTAPQRPYSFDQFRAQTADDAVRAMPAGPDRDRFVKGIIEPSVLNTETKATAAAGKPGATLNPQQVQALSPTLDAVLAEKGFKLDESARSQVISRAAQLYSTPVAQGGINDMQTAMDRAITELQSSGAPRVDYGFNPFSAKRFGTPAEGGGGIVPSTAAPAAGGGLNEGHLVHQNGKTYLIRNGTPVEVQ